MLTCRLCDLLKALRVRSVVSSYIVHLTTATWRAGALPT